jgi:hypothetical protein
VPAETPVTTPESSTDATEAEPDDQLPPEGDALSVVAAPTNMLAVPVIVGNAFTETEVVVLQPVLSV